MVSSKCLSVVSPSPFRFFAALIPPCAQTECERLTGTIEKRSTVPPASAILITAARPARPPPTTMMRGDAIEYRVLSFVLSQVFRRGGRDLGHPAKSVSDQEISRVSRRNALRDGRRRIVLCIRVLASNEGPYAGDAHEREQDAESGADIAEELAGGGSGSDADRKSTRLNSS